MREVLAPEVLVIGAGPAGLAAACAARARGASVVLLDSSDYLGGQYWRHLPGARPSENEAALHHGWGKFESMRHSLSRDLGCEVVASAQVWALVPSAVPSAEPNADTHEVHVLIGPPDGTNRESRVYRPRSIVLATGAHDRTLPFPGWDLPGVFSAGAAQALAKGERVAVGQNVVVAGAGPFLLPVAASLTQAGARVIGVYEASRAGSLVEGWLPRPWQLLGASAKLGELVHYAGNHVRHRIPYSIGHAVIEAHGTDRVESVTIAKVDARWAPIPGTEKTVVADAVCVSHGFTPRLELSIAAGCSLTPQRFVAVDEAQATSVAGVFAAGEITGIGGVDAALAEGTIAGHCSAGGAVGDAQIARDVAKRKTFTGFAARIEAAHGIQPGWTRWLRVDTVICRCEEVTYGKLRLTAKRTESQGLRSHKLTSRAGLGICQARICGRSVEQILGEEAPGGLTDMAGPASGMAAGMAAAASSDHSDPATTDRRPIVTPIRLGELASLGSRGSQMEHPHTNEEES